MILYLTDDMISFFAQSSWLDWMVLRPLSHIASNWETRWDLEERQYQSEAFSFADDLNEVIKLIPACQRPTRYHDHEDVLAEHVLRHLKWPIQKKGSRWIGADYASILEQGAFGDLNQQSLIASAVGRVHAALDYGQRHFDEMEDGHLNMLSAVLTIIIYHRYCGGTSLLIENEEADEG